MKTNIFSSADVLWSAGASACNSFTPHSVATDGLDQFEQKPYSLEKGEMKLPIAELVHIGMGNALTSCESKP